VAGWWPYLGVLLGTLLVRWPTLNNNIFSIDEPQYFAQAARLRTFDAFVYAFNYRIEVKSQIGLLPYMLAAAIDPANAVFWNHLLGLGMVLISAILMVAISRRFTGSGGPGMVAALLWLPYTVVGPGYALAQHTTLEYYPAPKLEYFQTPFILGAVYLFALALTAYRDAPRRAGGLMVGAGLAWAMTVLIKPSSLLLGPVWVLLLAALLLAREGRRGWLRPTLGLAVPFTLAALALVALVFLPYAWNPAALAELRFNLTETAGSYNDAGAASPITRLLALLITGMPPALLLLFLLGPLLARRFLRSRDPVAPIIPLLAVVGPLLLVASLAGCVCPHYYPPIIAAMNLTVALYLAPVFAMLRQTGRFRAAWATGILLAIISLAPQVPALLNFPATAMADLYRADDARRFDVDGLLTYIATHTTPDKSLWIYYNTSEIYLWAQRPPATRDPHADWLSFVWAEPWFTRTQAELAAEQPALIIGIDEPRLARLSAHPFDQIPQVSSWIQAHYQCSTTIVRGATICTAQGSPP
jgi:hypothetical protein